MAKGARRALTWEDARLCRSMEDPDARSVELDWQRHRIGLILATSIRQTQRTESPIAKAELRDRDLRLNGQFQMRKGRNRVLLEQFGSLLDARTVDLDGNV
ncbi:MAG: hypothetical protein M1818_006068 [Claussenomyces sp. TS43310]|nr:MAG: hypothetical protein M1818_006068 [Claussenomyces sp. TS43310]